MHLRKQTCPVYLHNPQLNHNKTAVFNPHKQSPKSYERTLTKSIIYIQGTQSLPIELAEQNSGPFKTL